MTAPTGAPDVAYAVRVILSVCQSDDEPYRYLQDDADSIDTRDVEEQPGHFALVYEPVTLLLKLYARLPPDQQPFIVPAMFRELDADNGMAVAHALVELRAVDALRDWNRLDAGSRALWQGIVGKLSMEHWTFSESDLTIIEDVSARLDRVSAQFASKFVDPLDDDGPREAASMRRVLTRLFRVLDRVRYLRLKQELLDVQNPIIDTDRRELVSRLDVLQFNGSLTAALDELERKSSAATSAFDFKSAMELLRTFFEEFMEEAARKASKTSTIPCPTGEKLGHFVPYKDYLRNAGVLCREEEEVLQKLYAYLSNRGSHVLGSLPEQFRVSKTTVIEWCLMIAGRIMVLQSA